MNPLETTAIKILPLRQFWDKVQLKDDYLLWDFSNRDKFPEYRDISPYQAAHAHLVRYEKYIRHFAALHCRCAVVYASESYRWRLSPRKSASLHYSFLPLPPHLPGADDEKFLVFAGGTLPGKVVDRLYALKESDRPHAIISWADHTQKALNKACIELPIGDSLEECFIPRSLYWYPPHYDQFLMDCEGVSIDGGIVNVTYANFDPLDILAGGDGKWMESQAEFIFVPCGSFGLYQFGICHQSRDVDDSERKKRFPYEKRLLELKIREAKRWAE